MPNLHRGEIGAVLDGRPVTLCLTLGALAELESSFATGDMLAVSNRFAAGRVSATDCIRIIGAGLRGAGQSVGDDAVSAMQADGGAAGFIDIVARLLAATFGGPVAGPIAVGVVEAVEGAVAAMAKAEAPQPPPPTPAAPSAPAQPAPQPFLGPR